jgi:hypothetical protein
VTGNGAVPADARAGQPGGLAGQPGGLAAQPGGLAALGLSWQESGQAGLRGPLLRLFDDCDQAFLRLAGIWRAEEERHPAALPAARLQRVDYLTSFPHQVTFAARLDPATLDQFVAGELVDAGGTVVHSGLSPVSEVLTPAACYHLYSSHAGASFDRPRYLTTRNTCFRAESRYEPLRRQWSFTMREIVCVGTPAEAADFLDTGRAVLDEFLRLVDLPVRWLSATDPFFQPRHNPQALMQRLQPSKHEATYGDLAIGSANRHHDHFGAAFELTRDGRPADTACLAVGLERWLFAITDRHGLDPAGWPSLTAAAEKVAAEAAPAGTGAAR